tara:strand:- start:14249 stop:14926 length:678 start_codon:yes stop_codon:yes gene_type:complete
MNLPSNFVKQTYDLRNEKGYATADTFFLNRLIELIKEYKITTIVEAGVFHGRSTVEMSYLVDEVIGIDIFSKMLEITALRMAKNSRKNYKLYHGNSPEVLSELTKEIDNDHTIFFLDAHMSAEGMGSEEKAYWPIIDEIKKLPRKKGIIVLHDIYVPNYGDLKLTNPQRLGYDTYIVNEVRQRFDYEFIEEALTEWSSDHRVEYNSGDKTNADQRGIAYIFPTKN